MLLLIFSQSVEPCLSDGPCLHAAKGSRQYLTLLKNQAFTFLLILQVYPIRTQAVVKSFDFPELIRQYEIQSFIGNVSRRILTQEASWRPITQGYTEWFPYTADVSKARDVELSLTLPTDAYAGFSTPRRVTVLGNSSSVVAGSSSEVRSVSYWTTYQCMQCWLAAPTHTGHQ